MQENIKIEFRENRLSIDQCFEFINDQRFGGNCLFIGTVRDHSNNQSIDHLEFETYEQMARKELLLIAQDLIDDFGPLKIYFAHKTGYAGLGEVVVIIGVATKHRKAAFEACELAIDRLKERSPIWKKEFTTDGNYWVNAHP